MEAIISALEEEGREAEKLIAKYEKELSKLPGGAFFVRTIGKGKYGYVTYSEEGVIKQKYLGRMDNEQVKMHKAQAQRVKKLKSLIKLAREQRDFIRKALRHANTKSQRSA